MKQTYCILVLFLFCAVVFSQTDSTKISFVAYWSVGDSYNFKVSKVKREWKNDILIKKDSSQYLANFNVLDSSATSYTIQWTYKNDIVNSFREKTKHFFSDAQIVNEIMQKNDLSKITYETNELGEFVQILNWKELGETLKLLLEEVTRSVQAKNHSQIETLQKAMAPLIEIFSSQEGIEQLVVNELQFFHFLFGVEYDVNQPITFGQEFDNMLGGKAIKGEATLTFEEVDFENYFCAVKEETVLNADDAKRVVNDLFTKMELDNPETKTALNNAVFDIKDLNYYEFYYNPGVPHSIYGSRKTRLLMKETGIEKLDELFIELIYDE